jgi:NADH dehydrogenase
MARERPHVVIIGGGFGGLYAAKELGGAPVRVTLIDRRNHHLFQPLLYQVATAVLNPGDIAAPIRAVLRGFSNIEVRLAEVTGIDVAGRRVLLGEEAVGYDHLIVAAGATHSYFGHAEWEPLAPGLKSIEDALDMRRRILLAYETAEQERDPARVAELLTFVVVGGGPTGVELAGALAEIGRHTMARDFRRIDPRQARVVLVEAMSRILQAYPPELSAKAERQLRELGVEVRTNALVTRIDEHGVMLDGDRIAAATVLWAAGVQASPLGRMLGAPVDKAGRVLVTPTLNLPGHDDVFVVGDLARLEIDGQLVPGLAPTAIQEGRHAARNVLRLIEGGRPEPFRYVDKGSMATIGRARAVAVVFGAKLSGFVAWLMWLFIHILYLIGFRSRLLVLIEWAWAYLTWQRGTRLITGIERPVPALSQRQAASLAAGGTHLRAEEQSEP